MMTIAEKVKVLTSDQKIALLGFLIGRLADDENFRSAIFEGAELFKNHRFDSTGNVIQDKLH